MCGRYSSGLGDVTCVVWVCVDADGPSNILDNISLSGSSTSSKRVSNASVLGKASSSCQTRKH